MLESDIKKALGARGTGERTDTTTVGIQAATIPSLHANNPTFSDIRVAGPTRLQINADVLPGSPGIEVVEWRLFSGGTFPQCGDTGRSGRNWCLRRTVTSSTGTIGETLTKGRGDYPANITSCAPVGAANSGTGLPAIPLRVFCYEEAVPAPRAGAAPPGSPTTYRANWSPTCLERWWSDGPNASGAAVTTSTRITTEHNRVDGLTSIARIDRIISVNASVYAGGAYGKASELSYEHVSATIRSREGEAYREAIMCGTKGRWGQ
jgi:hypothetical protein